MTDTHPKAERLPRLCPVAESAKALGVSTKLFCSAVERGQLGAVDIFTFGDPPQKYVSFAAVADFFAQRAAARAAGHSVPNRADLFT
ncbi:hypothetical protein SRS16CHR_01804 [Variovorax sp. SRS16]|uniref:hypothetical protein n=1 Tax=Variovorax sp. SRS16 TaxID=282217 RepID=UPI001318A65A|nr:hypothetical protein [Variovorax sp. SRS16]VTU16550.1 hypothetical protein SRS16CHR_01804 [Variovorax sp. SRS16]